MQVLVFDEDGPHLVVAAPLPDADEQEWLDWMAAMDAFLRQHVEGEE